MARLGWWVKWGRKDGTVLRDNSHHGPSDIHRYRCIATYATASSKLNPSSHSIDFLFTVHDAGSCGVNHPTCYKHRLMNGLWVVLDLSRGFNPLWRLSTTQVFIDPHWFSQKYIADPPLVLPQIEYWLWD